MRQNTVKQKLAKNQLTLGTWITIGHPDVAEMIAWAGFDWFIFDMEHAPLDASQIEILAQAVSAAPALPIVRVPWNDPVFVKRALDVGVSGVMIPYVNNKQEALQAVKSAKYPPVGIRGVAPRRASMYGSEFHEYLRRANDEVLVVLQIETTEAVKNIEDILSVDGIDVCFIGPLDLSFSAGYPAKTTHPKVQSLIKKVVEASESAGIRAGIDTPLERLQHYTDMGFKFISTGADYAFMLRGAREAVSAKTKKPE
jgi:2-dehydro-3-deoxyglucarate aldolase